jgi:ADP-heptose:LPS heptosyltransferase
VKILIVRFSSIGDVVLTTPVLRCLKKQLKGVEVHFITKKSFEPVVRDNPYIDKIYTISSSITEVLSELKAEKYDHIIDLHKNLRTASLKLKLAVTSTSFPKLNFKKWLLVKFKKDKMPQIHVVERYFKTVEHLGIKNDQLPCDFYISPSEEVQVKTEFGLEPKEYVAFALGAQFFTKRLPIEKQVEILEKINQPIVLIGGPTDKEAAQELIDKLVGKHVINACGRYSLQQSASIVHQSKVLLSHDTGMMHIATCFTIPIVSVWGNTVPALGMFPYYPQEPGLFTVNEVTNLDCRPCSKIGFKACPKGHFKCMLNQDPTAIASQVVSRMNS